LQYSKKLDTLERKAYQLIISRLNGDDINDKDYSEKIIALVKKGIGGFIVFGGEKDGITRFINELQAISEIPLFIASDIERGVEQQVKGATPFSCPMAIAAAIDKARPEDINLLENALRAVAEEAIDLGINMPLIPVLDVNQNPDNPIICTRAFSDNPETVSWFGTHYIKILEQSGLISCPKHFPGHGDTSIDSHISLPVINKAYDDLMKTDIMPFAEAINKGTQSIMIGHLTVPALDSRPASLSGKVISGLLRDELGFNGLVLTDALNMNALKDFGNVPVECINAGADILLHPSDADETATELLSAVKSGKITMERIESSIDLIVNTKHSFKKMRSTKVDYDKNRTLSSQIVNRSITLVKSTPSLLPIRNKETHAVLAGDPSLYGPSPLKDHFRVSTIDNAGRLKGDTILFALFTSVRAWKGSSGIDTGDMNRILELMKRYNNSIVISFGSPYVLRYFTEAAILIAAYEATILAQEAVIKCLSGELDFMGRLPIKLL